MGGKRKGERGRAVWEVGGGVGVGKVVWAWEVGGGGGGVGEGMGWMGGLLENKGKFYKSLLEL